VLAGATAVGAVEGPIMGVIIVAGGRRSRDEGFIPYRHLALHVLARALRDLSNAAAPLTDRESARLFLAGSPMLLHWCRVAALDPRVVTRHAARFTS
jgi:hypothetical protein